jgi:hypothetical protein
MSLAKTLDCDKLEAMNIVTSPTTAPDQLLGPSSWTLGVEGAEILALIESKARRYLASHAAG